MYSFKSIVESKAKVNGEKIQVDPKSQSKEQFIDWPRVSKKISKPKKFKSIRRAGPRTVHRRPRVSKKISNKTTTLSSFKFHLRWSLKNGN